MSRFKFRSGFTVETKHVNICGDDYYTSKGDNARDTWENCQQTSGFQAKIQTHKLFTSRQQKIPSNKLLIQVKVGKTFPGFF